MYPLRSRTKQSTIDFPCRKRRRDAESKNQRPISDENTPKKAKKTMPTTRSSRKAPRTSSQSPLKEQNGEAQTPEKVVKLEMTALHMVKRSLHNSCPPSLLCREDQLHTLSHFLHSHLTKRVPGAIYISGAPGTGKTACLSHILENSEGMLKSVSVVTVNCMSVKTPQAIFSRIATELVGQRSSKVKNTEEHLIKLIQSSRKMILIVLDEVDLLDSRGQEVLYTLFEWPALPRSNLVLVGIANALDLTDRILPRLQSHSECCPDLLHFPPYSKDQVVAILQERLQSHCAESKTIVDPMAVQFCARKVAAVHGDMRKALDICRRAIELVETQERCGRLKLSSGSDDNSPPSKPIRVTLSHIAAVISEVYSSTITPAAQQTFPLQQKLIVCTLLLVVRGRSLKEVTLGKLHDTYSRVCRHRKLRCETEGEFVGLCDMLETRGIIALKKAKEIRHMKVNLKLQESEVEHALQDRVLLSSILEQGIPKY